MSAAERDTNDAAGSRRLVFIVVAAVSVLLIAGLVFVMRQPDAGGGGPPRLEGALRPGAAEFEQYRERIVLDEPEATEATRAIGDIVMTLKTTVRNFTGRTINGLEMRAAVVDGQGNPVKERIVIVIPNKAKRQTELEPNKTLEVPVMLEGMSKNDWRADIKMEVTGVRFK